MIRRFFYGFVFCLLILGFVAAVDSFFLAQSAFVPRTQPLAATEIHAQEPINNTTSSSNTINRK